MQSQWIGSPERHFDIDALLRFTPLMAVRQQTPPCTICLLWCDKGCARVTVEHREEMLGGEHMLLVNACTDVTVHPSENDASIVALSISFLPGSDGLKLPYTLFLRDMAYAQLCTRSFDALPFLDVTGAVGCAISLLQLLVQPKTGFSDIHRKLCLGTLLLAVSDAVSSPDLRGNGKAHIARALRFIEDHYVEDVNVAMIAADVHLHPNYLHRLFSAEMRCTVGDYLLNYRMERARDLLMSTKTTIEDIARSCGIPNPQHFSKLFRKKYGSSPTAFRQKFDITCNYTQARTQFGVIDYAVPEFSQPIQSPLLPPDSSVYSSRGFVPLIKAYYCRADMLKSTKDKTNHVHPLFEVMYVQKGVIIVEAENEIVSVRQNQYIWLNAGVRHSLRLCDDTPSSVVNIEYALDEVPLPVATTQQLCGVSPEYREQMENAPPWAVLNDPLDIMGALLRQAVLVADSSYGKKEALCSSLTQECIAIIAAQQHAAGLSVSTSVSADPAAEAILNRISQMCLQAVTVGALARACQISPSRLQQVIRRATGFSVTEYVQHMRIEKSKELLLSGLSTDECAERIGFSNGRYFAQLFRRVTGITPAAFYSSAASGRPASHVQEKDMPDM